MAREGKKKEPRGRETAGLRRRIEELEAAVSRYRETLAAVKKSEKHYHALTELAQDCIFIITKELRVQYVNEYGAHCLGLSPGEIRGKFLKELFPPPIFEFQSRNLKNVFDSGELVTAEDRFALGGRNICLYTRLVPIKGKNGEVSSVLGISRDVTELKRVESDMSEKEKFFKNIFDSIQDGISILDKDLNIVSVNRTMEKWHAGRKPLHGKKCYEAYHGLAERCESCPSIRTLTTGKQDFEVISRKRADGSAGWRELYTFPLFDSQTGGVAGIIEYVRDISERKRAEQALVQEKNKLEAIFAALGDAISIQAPDFVILQQNRAHKELVGDHTGERCYHAFHGRDRVCEDCPVAMAFKDGKTHTVEKKAAPNKKGIEFVDIAASPLIDSAGRIIAGIEAVRNVTDRRKMEEELQKTQRLESIGILAGGIAHDFNNILTAVIGNVGIAKKQIAPESEVHDILAKVEKAALRAKTLTRQLLTFSKGGTPLKKIISLAELIKDSLSFSLKGSNVRCECRVPDDLWQVEVDEGQINQVINNLIINAKEAMPGGGTITVTAENAAVLSDHRPPLKQGKYVKVTVADQGAGISEENFQRIFDPFFTTKPKGSGLGLAIAYSVVKKHNGLITVESKPGSGTAFSLFLPASAGTRRSAPAEEKPLHGRGRVLVMDDEEIIRDTVWGMSRNCGYEVEAVTDGTAAVELYRQAKQSGRPFDAVILDLTVPGGMGGQEAVKLLLELDPAAKVIASSGYSDDPVMADFKAYGFEDVLPKPYEGVHLSRVLHRVISGAES